MLLKLLDTLEVSRNFTQQCHRLSFPKLLFDAMTSSLPPLCHCGNASFVVKVVVELGCALTDLVWDVQLWNAMAFEGQTSQQLQVEVDSPLSPFNLSGLQATLLSSACTFDRH